MNDFDGKVEIDKAIININTPTNLQSSLYLGEQALVGNNGEEALLYANKALEANPTSVEAWKLKMRALDYVGTLGNPRVDEIINCGRNAIAYSNGDNIVKKEVYEFYLAKASAFLSNSITQMSDVDGVKSLYDSYVSVSPFSASEKTSESDSGMISLLNQLAMSAVSLKAEVPVKSINDSEILQSWVKDIAESYVLYAQKLNDRFNIYGLHLSDEAVNANRTILAQLKEGLSSEEKELIDPQHISNPVKSGGCLSVIVLFIAITGALTLGITYLL